MESRYYENSKIMRFQNIKVTTKRWKALIVLPICTKSIKKEKLSINSMWIIGCILN